MLPSLSIIKIEPLSQLSSQVSPPTRYPCLQAIKAERGPAAELADTMDALMELTFQHLEVCCATGQLRGAWTTLLGALERTLVSTHRCKFTQFLLFYLAQQVGRTLYPTSNPRPDLRAYLTQCEYLH